MLNQIILISLLLFFNSSAICQQGEEELRLIEKADSAYSFKKWDSKDDPIKIDLYIEARKLYAQALKSFPDKEYIQNRIFEIDRIIADFNNRPEYLKTLQIADSLYENNECELARTMYIKSDSILSFLLIQYDKSFLKDRINICSDALQIEVLDSSIAFIQSVRSADKLFLQFRKDRERDAYNLSILDSSYAFYLDAISLYDSSNYVSEKIDRIEKIKSYNERLFFDQLFRSAESNYHNEKYKEALAGYMYLMGLKPEDTYLNEMIEKCKNKMK